MDKLFLDLNAVSKRENVTSVHLADFPKSNENQIDSELEERMAYAQNISSLVHSLRKKESIKVRQPLLKVMIPSKGDVFEKQILAVEDLIKTEVNIKEIEKNNYSLFVNKYNIIEEVYIKGLEYKK